MSADDASGHKSVATSTEVPARRTDPEGDRLRVVVLISGTGSNLRALLEACDDPGFPARFVAVGADREAPGLEFARARGIDAFVVDYARYSLGPRSQGAVGSGAHSPTAPTPAERQEARERWAAELAERVEPYRPGLVVLAGLMRVLPASFVERFSGRLINMHPALLPAHPGAHAVRDALAAGDRVTGTTVHYVDAGVDTGPIIAQRPVPILAGDDESTLHARIKSAEHGLLVAVVRDLARSARR